MQAKFPDVPLPQLEELRASQPYLSPDEFEFIRAYFSLRSSIKGGFGGAEPISMNEYAHFIELLDSGYIYDISQAVLGAGLVTILQSADNAWLKVKHEQSKAKESPKKHR